MKVTRRLPRPAMSAAAMLWLTGTALAGTDDCLLQALGAAPDSVTAGELRQTCGVPAAADPRAPLAESVVGARIALERYGRDNPFVLTAHRPNFLLPVVYNRLPDPTGDEPDPERIELQFQISQKILLVEGLFGEGEGHLAVAYTNRSSWQAYNSEVSSPFRDTSHEPEIMLTFESRRRIGGFRNVANQLVLNHQSNGRTGDMSRSWNRVMLNAIFERENIVVSLMPWYRIPEGAKVSPTDMTGDDNPDIERYMGNFELNAGWIFRGQLYGVMVRNNLRSENRGAVEFSWSFPIHRNLRGTVRYFNGYGETLLNYNRWSESIGAGILIGDWL